MKAGEWNDDVMNGKKMSVDRIGAVLRIDRIIAPPPHESTQRGARDFRESMRNCRVKLAVERKLREGVASSRAGPTRLKSGQELGA